MLKETISRQTTDDWGIYTASSNGHLLEPYRNNINSIKVCLSRNQGHRVQAQKVTPELRKGT